MEANMLTEKQQEILTFIESFYKNMDRVPSVRQIAAQFDISPRAAQQHLVALKKK
ncbi:MAG: SOS-response transcriptional repressor LexA, partial [Candidatus Marinamargulisbacteria bacterium]